MAPSPSSLFSTYVSISTSVLPIRSIVDNFIPNPMRNFLLRRLYSLLLLRSPSTLTLVIEEYGGITQNQLYSAAEIYLSSRISPDIQRLRVSKSAKEDNLNLQFDRDERINDTFEGIVLKWVFVCTQSPPRTQGDMGVQFLRHSKSVVSSLASSKQECRYFELSFDQKHKERVLSSYLPYILEQSKAIRDAEKVVRLHTYVNAQGSSKNIWESVILRHPSTFETLTMDIEQKKAIIDDLDRFVRRKEFYNKVGRAWKRGYLLYGPPGTALVTLLRTLAEETIPDRLRSYIVSSLKRFFLPPSSQLTLIIDQFCGPTSNEIYQAAHIYLPTKISPSHDRIQVSKPSKQSNSTITLPKGAQVEDSFRNIRLQWKLVDDRKLFFELSFDKQFIEIVLESYLPYVIAMSKDVNEEDEEVRIYIRKYATQKTVSWDSIQLHHPAKFESFAMDPDQKKEIMEDLDRFTKRKELYKKIGKAWKRGYLLYGPSGTDKSSLIAAMANHLKFDIYDLKRELISKST